MSQDLLPYFLAEGRELAERARAALSHYARGGGQAALEEAFRAFHTLKGGAALFDFAELGALLHEAESELERARRDGALAREALDWLTDGVGEAERWLEALEASGEVAPERRRAAAALAARMSHAPAAAPAPSRWWAQDLAGRARVAARTAIRYTPDAEAYFRGEDPLALIRAVPDLLWLDLDRRDGLADTPFVCDLTLTALSGAPPEAVAAALRLVGDQAEIVALDAAPAPAPSSRTVRVEAAALDDASDLLDQLILAKNALAHETAPVASPEIARAQLTLDRAAAALHDALGRMRLAPLSRLFAPLPRQVREMAEALGKSAELTIAGEEVALDKAIMDGLYEPLIHILRNAVDHGIERPEARREAGKPERGAIRIEASPRGDVAEIVVSDDGAGLDIARIRARAAERDLGDAEAADLVFTSGFSTAREVTELSGRGVGLDAVRAALARIGGRVEIENRPGQGLAVRMTAPLRTVLARVAVVAVGAERFGVPLHSIAEIVRVRRSEITAVRKGEAVVVRDEATPLLRLAALVGATPQDLDTFPALIVEADGERVGVAVDRVETIAQAPIQAASPLLSGLTGVLGSMLQGDGRVLLLLDLKALIHASAH